MTCEECKAQRQPETIPYIAHESAIAHFERQMKRAFVIIIILIVMLVGSNVAWLYYENSFDEVVTTTYEADATDGGNAIANGSGSVNVNGEG